jgi:hypothetical protein
LEKDFERRVLDAVSKLPIMKWFKEVSGIGPRLSGSLAACVQDIENFATISKLWAYMGMAVIPICTKCNKIAYRGKARIKFCRRQAERRWDVYSRSEKYQTLKKKGKAQSQEEFIFEATTTTNIKLCQHAEDEYEVRDHAPQKKYYGGLLLNYSPFAKTTSWKIAVQFVKQGKFYRGIYDYHKARYVERHEGDYTAAHVELMAKRATVKLFLSHMFEMWRKSLNLEAGKIWLMEQKGMDFDTHEYIPPPYSDIYDEKPDEEESSRVHIGGRDEHFTSYDEEADADVVGTFEIEEEPEE